MPRVSSINVETEMNRFDINIKLGGGITSDFASLFEVFFVGPVANLIEHSIEATLKIGIPTVGNAVMERLDGYFPVPFVPQWVVDWETDEAALVTSSYFAIGVKGLMFEQSHSTEEPDVDVPIMPYHNSSHMEKFQMCISTYTMDSVFNSLLEVHKLGAWIPASRTNLTTTLLNALLPGIVKHYGSDIPVDIHFEIVKIGDFEVEEAN